MSCTCGHHHDHTPLLIQGGKPIPLRQPLIALEGRLICKDMAQMMLALDLLTDLVSASRAEPGNLRYDLSQTDDPLIWKLNELFTDADAFAAHQARIAASRWGRESGEIGRDFQRTETLPRIRPEASQDQTAIRALLNRAFGSDTEARLVDALRDAGDLAFSLVADAEGTIVGHLALSPVTAQRPALALAPVAVDPRLHGRGIGTALVQAALEAFADHIIVVLGDPAWYGRFGFSAVDWQSPYAGPCLQALSADLPKDMTIAHAPAFGPAPAEQSISPDNDVCVTSGESGSE